MPRKRTSDTDISVSRGAAAVPRRQTTAKPRAKRAEAAVEPAEITTPQITAPEVPAAPAAGPTRAEIALLAYSLWESRGYHGGSPEEDWLRAEEQLKARANAANA
jgi:hypothetical protein